MTEPDTPRPYRLPLSTPLLALACVPPMLLCILLLCLASPGAWLFFLVATAASVATFLVNQRCGSTWAVEEGARAGGYGQVHKLPPAHCPDASAHVEAAPAEVHVEMAAGRAGGAGRAAGGGGAGRLGSGGRGDHSGPGPKEEMYRQIAARARERIDALGRGADALAIAAQVRGLPPPEREAPAPTSPTSPTSPTDARADAKSPLLWPPT